jgi:hypothetical protein
VQFDKRLRDGVRSGELGDITPDLARASGFKGVVDLLKVAKHGPGENVYLIRFHYLAPARRETPARRVPRRRAPK